MELLALNLANVFGQWVWPLLGFFVGLGLVVFVHELGHFLVAKSVGIRVERFAIGMGPKVAGVKLGETEYCICALPIGGYVKMTGQDDFAPNPDQASPDKPTGEDSPDQPKAPYDPRAFQNKSVGARFAVVSAGVIMNLIFAAVLFVIIGMVGKQYPAPVVGDVTPGSPAQEALIEWQDSDEAESQGLTSGDRITGIDGDSMLMKLISNDVQNFGKIAMVAILANDDDQFTMTIERDVNGQTRTGQARIGVTGTQSNIGTTRKGFGIYSALTPVIGLPENMNIDTAPFKPGQRITAIGNSPVREFWDIAPIEQSLTGEPVDVTVEDSDGVSVHSVMPTLRFAPDTWVFYFEDGNSLKADSVDVDGDTIIAIDTKGDRHEFNSGEVVGGSLKHLELLGMIPRVRVESVEAGSPADNAGIKPQDIIIQYAQVRHPSPARLVELTQNAGDQKIGVTVLRDDKFISMKVAPHVKGQRAQIGIALGLDTNHLVAADVRPNSPAQLVGIEPGSIVTAVNDIEVTNWAELYNALKANQDQTVEISCKHGDRAYVTEIELDSEAFDPEMYGFTVLESLAFEPMQVTILIRNPISAIGWGIGQTWEFLITNYASLKQLVSGQVHAREMTGPLGIGSYAVMAGRKGIIELVHFMAFISVALAVMNFLPIPVVDGGMAVFLIIEKIRGKPLAPKPMWIIQVIGLVFLGAVLLAVTFNDIVKFIGGTM